ncbi:hypothetical protein CC80DRAFT_532203 [Byssothecium circinans]|uniref:Uncharacterized protein n=1 Tax=Byssothecium circinans TaxID=147558 RepID=A0A6A5U782_9PLEO|nr:hypothetical protein CC80DRAFT_532203 [Byssothecium circinans]
MHYSTFLLALPLLTTALPSLPLQERATDLGPEVRAQIDVLNSSVIQLTSAVNAFDGTLLGWIPQSLAVVSASVKLDGTIVKTTQLAQASSNFTEAGSSSIVTTLASLVTPIGGSLDALVAKYPLFKKRLEAPIVLLNLKILKTHTGDLVEALGGKVTANWAPYLTLGRGVLDAAFDKAIAVYSA